MSRVPPQPARGHALAGGAAVLLAALIACGGGEPPADDAAAELGDGARDGRRDAGALDVRHESRTNDGPGDGLPADSPPADAPAADQPAHDSGADGFDPGLDSDGDGLPDGFEQLFGLDPDDDDTDDDGTADGEEDEDQDGLTVAEEWAAWNATALQLQQPSPLHKDLLVEVDYQIGRAPGSAVLQTFIAAFAAAEVTNLDGQPGIAAHVLIDEEDLPAVNMSEVFSERLSYLAAHGPTQLSAALPLSRLVHVMFVSERPGNPSRGGDTLASGAVSVGHTGSLVYVGNLAQIFPVCTNPAPPAVSVEEAVASTFIHEVGHLLQLGHDTSVGGGVNAYNIMATDLGSCELLKRRTRGLGNSDAALGATEQAQAPRFSAAAAALFKLTNKISAETNDFEVPNGYAM